jgi:preprotein translocase subunit SecB|uniref:Protein-export protein SecB n=2 Tax=Magnetospirillum gryphiswaldense TaxID=55518 RepID=A4U2B6_9PROT|nr:protein-export chaperone SecB [Magnetospirillum gryphiswaldense]CAM77023.1 Bacterial protein export chaperone SecB [Magnetospirillum gryphiswaldense MSR-1]
MMSDENNMPPLVINGQYVKDLSFEVPGAPGIYGEMAGQNPEIPIHVDINAAAIADKTYEVTLHLKVEAHLAENKPVFIAELAYAGIFTLNVPDEHIQPMLLIECPRLLFPFARSIIADMTRDGAFPPLMIQPIDFMQLYRSRMEAAQGQEAGHA